MKLFYTPLLILLATTCYADQMAITDKGEEITLYDNGTWEYSGRLKNKESTIIVSTDDFEKPDEATFLLKSVKNKSTFWLNTRKWAYKKAIKESDAEFEFQLKGENLYGLVIAEEIQIPLDSFIDIAFKNALSIAPNTQILRIEYRTVNGKKVIYIEMAGTIEGKETTYFGYYYSDTYGSTQYLAYTATELVSKYKREIDDFLNGLDTQ